VQRLIIISGGQTGVDRGALDAALEAHAPCSGWCPQGRQAEDGPIPARYPLQELPSGGYTRRTRQNVEDSDGTLILTFGPATGGTERTIEFCRRLARPHLILDAAAMPIEEAERCVVEFIRMHAIERLNVAGPRASTDARGYEYARALIGRLLRACRAMASAPTRDSSPATPSRVPADTVQAYRETLFVVQGDHPIMLRIGERNDSILSLYVETQSDCCAFITACNPYSEPLNDVANAERQARLERGLAGQGWKFFPGLGKHPSGDWLGEPSFLVLGVSREEAKALGERFEQNAIVWCGADAVPELVLLR
jgi:hypothetical protein